MKFLFLLIIGGATSLAIIRLLKTSMMDRVWAYPLLLASFPVFYMLFALWINDKSAMKTEFQVGLIFFILIAVYLRYRAVWSEYLLAAGFLAHGLYDITHDLFFLNRGVPIWWPEFCGTIDLFIGLFLIYQIRTGKSKYIEKKV